MEANWEKKASPCGDMQVNAEGKEAGSRWSGEMVADEAI